MHQNRDEFYSRSLFFLIFFFFSINSLPVNPVYIIGFPIVFFFCLLILVKLINISYIFMYILSC